MKRLKPTDVVVIGSGWSGLVMAIPVSGRAAVDKRWAAIKKLSDIVAGKTKGRSGETEITLFKSNGVASWDLAVAVKVYTLARQKGLGRELPFWRQSAKLSH